MLAKKPKGAVERRQGGGVASLLWMFVGALLTVMCLVVLYLWNPFDIGSETKTEERKVEPINQPKTETNDFEFYDLLPDQEMISLPDEAVVVDDTTTVTTDELKPDVIVTQPGSETRDNTISNIDSYGTSQDTTTNPSVTPQTPQTPSASGEPDIVIVEEEGTYDDPAPQPNNNTQGAATNRPTKGNMTAQSAAKSAPLKQSYILQINSFSSAEDADKRRAQVLMAGVDAYVVKTKMANGQVIYQVVSPTMTNRQKVVAAQQKLQNNGIDSLVVEQRR
ncbi:SPOR domain-containing protein [Psychrobacter sanguinis]|uniref:SPOR domain-containing protein n=1 Tax=Psychrobacter sanguinis TaxID=861445 RepID=UPI0019195D72|nr:SPOR domain-containing protein [Psychrobacter sanguinis]MCC3346016.1 SPOR domain-containing protein [Psychrobacter sanguinis]